MGTKRKKEQPMYSHEGQLAVRLLAEPISPLNHNKGQSVCCNDHTD